MEHASKSNNKYGLYIKTYGCQMNVYDSIKMEDLLKPHGFCKVEGMEEAHIIILNTCHIREKASEKVYSELGRIKKIQDKRSNNGHKCIICVAGCVGQAEGEEIFARAPFVDIVVGPQSYHNLPELIERVKRREKWVIDLDFKEEEKFDKLPQEGRKQGVSAFITVQEGCDKFCHFCCVPYTRGAEYCRPPQEIMREAMLIAASGSCEITLLGQNVTAYSAVDHEGKSFSLSKLIRAVAGIESIERIRYTTSHPTDMNEELITTHREVKKLMPYLHLPVQSGSNNMLKSMNRNHTRNLYFEIIEKLRQARPDIEFSSDFIVGYPGETDQDFEDTLDLVEKVGYSECYSFKYSPRPGTPAATYANQINEEVKSARLHKLQGLLKKQQKHFLDKKVGKILQVLIEKPGRYENQCLGKTEHMQTVNINNCPPSAIGKIVQVKIEGASQNTLHGLLVE